MSILLVVVVVILTFNWDELYKHRSSRKIDPQRLFSREHDFPKTFFLAENQFSQKTYFYTIASRFAHRRALPPGPILPLPILRRLWWSRFYGKNEMEIILTLRKEYDGGIFSVNLGYRRVTIMSDFDKVQACCSHFISKASKWPGHFNPKWWKFQYFS